MRSRKFSMTSRIEKRVEILSRDFERTLTSDIRNSVCFAREKSSSEVDGVVDGRLRTLHLFFLVHNGGKRPKHSGRCLNGSG